MCAIRPSPRHRCRDRFLRPRPTATDHPTATTVILCDFFEGVPGADARAFALSHGAAAEIGDERALATLLDDLFGDSGGGSGGTGGGSRDAAPYAQPSTKPIHWETLHAGDDKLTHDSVWRRESERGRDASVTLLPEDELEVGNEQSPSLERQVATVDLSGGAGAYRRNAFLALER